MENQQCIQEDEIDIRKYIGVIIKRKKLILALFLVSVITAAIISLRMPRVYEITTTVQLGGVNEILIKNEEAKSIMLNQNLLLSVINELSLKTEVENFQKAIKISDIAGTNLLKIRITSPSIDMAFKINDAIVKPLITQGQFLFQKNLSIIDERLKELDMEIKAAPSSSLTALRNQRNGLKLLIINAKDFKISDAPIRPKNLVKLKTKENIFIAGMYSLILGVFLAFFLEFWQKSKK